MTWQHEGSGGWEWPRSGSSFSKGGAPHVQQYSAKECDGLEIRHWREWTCTNCQTIGWSGRKKCRHCRVKKSFASALSTHRAHSGSGWTQAKPSQASWHTTGLPAATTSRGAAAICLSKRSSTHGSVPRHALCRLLWSRGGHETDQTRGESFQHSGHRCACARGVEKIFGTTDHRAEDAAESLTTPQQETGGCERRLTVEEARAAFMLAQSVKGQANQEAKKKQSELCALEEEVHSAGTVASSTRRLLRHHRQYHHRIAPS